MTRFHRPPFDPKALPAQPNDEMRNRLIFDWWCDDPDRLAYIGSLRGRPTPIPSRATPQDDPALPLDRPAPQGWRTVWLLTDPADIRAALTQPENFGNRPYATLGGGTFLLGQDPGAGDGGVDWHAEQQALIHAALGAYPTAPLRRLATRAVEQAALTSLASPEFDLAQFALQAGLRYLGQLWGYGFQDHVLLESAAQAAYRALQYIAIGQHFTSEPATVPAAQQALGALVGRTSELMEAYTRLQRSPRRYGWPPRRQWPTGVQPWSELGLAGDLGEPLLKRLPRLPGAPSGRDRALIAATLLAGTLGNIQSAVCLLTRSLLLGPQDEFVAARDQPDDALEADLLHRLAALPPLPVIPRRTRRRVALSHGVELEADTDCLLLLEGPHACPHAPAGDAGPRVWGDVAGGTQPGATHPCLGRALAPPLIAALVRHVLRLPGLVSRLDPLTGERLEVQRLWGFSCSSYPLRYERERVRAQQNLIVSMKVKSPVATNAAALRRLIAASAPSIEHELTGFGGVHFAWFEFSDDDSRLVLRTIFDGQFESYIQHFALRSGDLFDGLFEYLEDAPPRPVAEFPEQFVEVIRRFNRAPLAGYLYSAYPNVEAGQIRRGLVHPP